MTLVDKKRGEALERLERVLERVRERLEDLPEKEVENDVLEALKALRPDTGD